MSKQNSYERQDSNLSKGSLARQNTTKNLNGQKSFFSKFSNTMFKPQEDEIQFLTKGQDHCMRILMYLLLNFDGMEQYLKKQSVLTPLNSYSPITKQVGDIRQIRTELIYYFQIISIRDFHDFYVDFYATFDKNKNFSLEPAEFKQLLDIAVNKCVGAKKFKVITDLFLSDPSLYDNQLDDKVYNEMIDNFRDLDKESKIDYLLLFPYILGFFLEFTYSQIKYRQGRLDLMRGTEIIKGKEVEIRNITSLVTILKEMGIDYIRDKRTTCLTYRDVENVLIKLKNIQKWITFDIIKQIINQLAKLMEVDPKTQNEGKPLKLYKIVNFLALKLCIHQNCLNISKQDKDKSKPPSAYLEILVLWNTAMFGQIMREPTIKQQFSKFLNKHYKDQTQLLRPEAIKILEAFFKKKFQLMPKDLIKVILEQHPEVQGKKIIQTPITTESLVNELFNMMCKDGYRKLKEYIRISYDGVNKSNGDRISQYQKQGKDFYEDSQIHSPPSSEKQQKSPKFDEKSKKSQISSQQNQHNLRNHSESEESDHERELTAKGKLKRVVKVISSEQAFAQKAESKKDVLKACLIMDSFLKRQSQMHQKMQQSKYNQNDITTSKIDEQEILLETCSKNDEVSSVKTKIVKNVQMEESKKFTATEISPPEQEKEQGEEKKDKKLFQQQRPQIVIKDIRKNSESQSNDLFTVAGKEGKNQGPQNFKNAYYGNMPSVQEASKVMFQASQSKQQLFQLTDDDFKDDEGKFQVVIDDVQLQTQILYQQNLAKTKKPKDRSSTCYYCSIQ
ncbi:unnamed protein product [Paramecium octaurelia]|uniref:Uncharacterized protein n=1 Tax=Paramecium octaurelia TaxID=43137 RepID=A0A8S1S2Z7_PAROT|nr:unnamed protein product [Paramecium octaurelia]